MDENTFQPAHLSISEGFGYLYQLFIAVSRAFEEIVVYDFHRIELLQHPFSAPEPAKFFSHCLEVMVREKFFMDGSTDIDKNIFFCRETYYSMDFFSKIGNI